MYNSFEVLLFLMSSFSVIHNFNFLITSTFDNILSTYILISIEINILYFFKIKVDNNRQKKQSRKSSIKVFMKNQVILYLC